MYSEITANKRKSVFLIGIFTVLIVGLGWILGLQAGDAVSGIIAAGVLSTVMTLIGFYKGDAVSLAAAGAKQIDRKDAPELYAIVENLTITNGMPLPKIYVINDPSPNAFATGRDPEHASIAVTTGLAEILDRSELEGVIAHELSHIKNYDIRVMTLVVVLVGVILLLSDWALRMGFGGRRNRAEGNAALILFVVAIVLAILSPIFAQLIKLAVSRQREYLADASGALLTRYPDGLARALEKIALHDRPLQRANHATAHLFLANPFDPHVTKKFEHWFSTHPPIEERITRLRAMGH